VRILHVSEVHWGGVVSLLRHFTEQQVAHGHEVHLLAPPSFPRLDGVHHHDWRLVRERPRTYLSGALQLRWVLRGVKPDVVHLHSFLGGFFGRLPGVRSVTVPTLYQPHAWAFDLYPGLLRRLIMLWERLAVPLTAGLAVNCQDELDEGHRIGLHRPGHVLGVAVDLKHFRPPTPEEKAAAKERAGFTSRPVILVPGRIAYQKAQDLLVPAWERDPDVDVDVVLVGPGDCNGLRDLAPTQWGRTIHCMGEFPDLRDWYWASDVVAIPSRYEGFPLVAAEAMATGLPVIATAFNGASEVIEAGPLGAGGQVVALNDMAALIDACKRQVRVEDAQIGLRSRARALQLCEPKVVHDRLDRAYQAVRSRRV
jgi:glycosyltransferase involved in cell wall biosynthesis